MIHSKSSLLALFVPGPRVAFQCRIVAKTQFNDLFKTKDTSIFKENERLYGAVDNQASILDELGL